MPSQFLEFFDPYDPLPAWAVALAFSVLVLAAAIPAPERRTDSASAHWSAPVSNLTVQ